MDLITPDSWHRWIAAYEDAIAARREELDTERQIDDAWKLSVIRS